MAKTDVKSKLFALTDDGLSEKNELLIFIRKFNLFKNNKI